MKLNQVSKMFGIAATEPSRAYYNRELVWGQPDEPFFEPPPETGYLVGWYDAADSTTVTTSTTDLQSFTNKAAGSYGDMTQLVNSLSPVQYGATQDQIAGKNTIMFTGDDGNSKFKAGQHTIDSNGTQGTFTYDTTWYYNTQGNTFTHEGPFLDYPRGSNNPVYLTIVRHSGTDWACIRTHDCANSPTPGTDSSTWIDATAYIAGRPTFYRPGIGAWSKSNPYGGNSGNKNNMMYYANDTAGEWVEKKTQRIRTPSGQSPFLNSTHTDSMSGHTLVVMYKALDDPDDYRGSPRLAGSDYAISYDFPEESGRGNLFFHNNPMIQSHAPWERGNLYYDSIINGTRRRIQTSWNPEISKDKSSDAVNEDWSFWSTFSTPTLLSYTTNTHLGEHYVFVDGEKRLSCAIPINETYEITSNAQFQLGGASWQGSCILCEVLCFDDAIDRNSQTLLEGYLAHKWGSQNQLPFWHVYKNTPPALDLLNERFGMDLSSVNYTVYGA